VKTDFLIVGQGLAGTLTGHALERMGASVVIMGLEKPHAASSLAAGIIHPVSGRKFVKAWLYDQLIAQCHETYEEIERNLGVPLFRKLDMHLYISSVKEENDLLSQARRYSYDDLLRPLAVKDRDMQNSRRGYAINAFQLDIQGLLGYSANRWKAKQRYLPEHMEYPALSREGDSWRYKDVVAGQVIFCEGVWCRGNPWFSHLPVIPNKGQVLTLDPAGFQNIDYLVKSGLLLTRWKEVIWAGATYEWDFDYPGPDSYGWNYLYRRLENLLSQPYRVRSHMAGLRPTVPDRKPILAEHAELPGLWAVNGFGTKGSSLGPYVTRHLADLLNGREKINRFSPSRFKE